MLSKKTQNRRYFFLLLFFAVLPIVFSSTMVLLFFNYSDWFFGGGISTLIIFYSFSILTMALALTPTTVIAILSGYFFSWPGLAAIVVAYPLAALIGLAIGKLLNKKIVGNYLAERPDLSAFFEQLHQREFLMIVFARLSPILPFSMINVALGAFKLNLSNYVLATMIGMLPRTFIFFWTGKNALDIWKVIQDPTPEGILQMLPVLLILISSVGLLWILQKSIKRAKNQNSV